MIDQEIAPPEPNWRASVDELDVLLVLVEESNTRDISSAPTWLRDAVREACVAIGVAQPGNRLFKNGQRPAGGVQLVEALFAAQALCLVHIRGHYGDDLDEWAPRHSALQEPINVREISRGL